MIKKMMSPMIRMTITQMATMIRIIRVDEIPPESSSLVMYTV